MGLFWDYFKKELRFPFLLKGGALAMLAEGGGIVLDAARDVVLQLRDQFFPSRCEQAYLTNYARSRGIVRNPLEPEEHWLARVRFAYNWWVRGGRASAMAEALRIGFDFADVMVINHGAEGSLIDETSGLMLIDETTGAALNYERNSLRWAEFSVIIYFKGNESIYTMDQIIWAINEVKPARSKLAEIFFMSILYDETSLAGLYDESSNAPLTA